MIRKIWKKFNISTIFILPLFWKITKDIKCIKSKVRFPFIQLCIEYGLINTYLYRDHKFNGKLYLLFDKELFTTNFKLTDSKYISILELLIDCKYYSGIEMSNDLVLVSLNIPEEFLADILILESGKYSKLSKEYKDELHIKQTSVPITKNEIAMYISIKNLGYSIAMKSVNIKRDLETELKLTINIDDEYYERFNEEKENISRLLSK